MTVLTGVCQYSQGHDSTHRWCDSTHRGVTVLIGGVTVLIGGVTVLTGECSTHGGVSVLTWT